MTIAKRTLEQQILTIASTIEPDKTQLIGLKNMIDCEGCVTTVKEIIETKIQANNEIMIKASSKKELELRSSLIRSYAVQYKRLLKVIALMDERSKVRQSWGYESNKAQALASFRLLTKRIDKALRI